MPHSKRTILDRVELTAATWEFGKVGFSTYATQLRLLPNGRIAGYRNQNEHRWELRGDTVVLLDRAGIPTTIFDQVEYRDGKRYLEGGFVGGATHFLREVAAIGTILPARRGTLPTAREHLVPRRNLVILRAGEASRHRAWAHDIDAAHLNWDLCVSWYDDPARYEEDPDAQYQVLQPRLHKFQAIYRLLHAESRFWAYDYVMCPDDDLDWSWKGVNTAFEIMRDFDLLLAQPSLESAGYPIHDITRRVEGNRLRFTTFVEVMTPIFSIEALRICAPTFGLSRSAFGLDHIWPKLLGEPEHRIAIIDETAVVHTRPQAVNYGLSDAIDEGRRLVESFRAVERYDELGSIRARP